MAKQPRLYSRLTRATASLASYRSLWLGPDHLLVVTSTTLNEEYRRILLRDIQGFFIVDSERRTLWNVAWIVVGVISGIFMMATILSGSVPVFSLALVIGGVIGLLWNILLGPSCKVYVMTGVQTMLLPSLVRKSKAHKVLARIGPMIESAQRELVPPVVPPASDAAEPPIIE